MWEGERMTTANYLLTGAPVIPLFLTALKVFAAAIGMNRLLDIYKVERV